MDEVRRTQFIYRVREKDALGAMLLYRQRRINEEEMCAVCWPYIGRVSAEIVWRFKSGEVYFDDLKSELWLIFTKKIIFEYKESSGPLTPYVMQYAYNIGRDMLKATRNLDFYDDENLIELFGNTKNHSTFLDENEIDKKKAIEIISMKLAQKGIFKNEAYMATKENFVPGFSTPNPEPTHIITPVPKRRMRSELSEASTAIHKELRSIRLSLGCSQEKMKEALGIGGARYASYEYGRTSSVPDKIMNDARALLALHNEKNGELQKRFDMPMSQLLERWMKMVGVKCNYKKIATICNVSPSTVNRWAENSTHPSLSMLNEYEIRVIKSLTS